MSHSGSVEGAGVRHLGLVAGMVVEELGWDEDVDEGFRQALMDVIDAELVEESTESVDAVILWLRDGDGDIVDLLIDSLTDLGPAGFVWILTPKIGREGHVAQASLAEGAVAAGLALTSTLPVCADWSAHKVVRHGRPR